MPVKSHVINSMFLAPAEFVPALIRAHLSPFAAAGLARPSWSWPASYDRRKTPIGGHHPDVAPFNVARGGGGGDGDGGQFQLPPRLPLLRPSQPIIAPWGLFAPVVGGGRWKRQLTCRSLVGRRTTNRCCRRRCHSSLLLRDVRPPRRP